MKAWRVQFTNGEEIVIQMPSVLSPDDDEEFDDVLVDEVRKTDYDPDFIDDYWPDES